MKPTKNKTFCNGCRRPKMLFESQQKADNFIKFNSATILEETGKAPVRSYYCTFCGGYHVTSNTSSESGEILDNRDHQIMDEVIMLNRNRKDFNKNLNWLTEKIVAARNRIIKLNIEDAKNQIDLCIPELENMKKMYPSQMGRLIVAQKKINSMQEVLNNWDYYYNLTDEDVENRIITENPSYKESLIKEIVKAKSKLRK